MSTYIVWSLILAVHLLGITYWVGGSLYTVLVMRRSVSLLDPTPRSAVILQSYARFFRGLWHVMGTTLVSGWAMIFHDGGFGAVPLPINIMQGLALVMAIVFVTTVQGPFRRARRALRPSAELFDTLRLRTTIMAVCGILTIITAAFAGTH
ncbi:hypothetical protein AA106555_0391 [Neokomagataea thailandica NBRC 106555]|uniref:Copper resistance protein D domain-containing protein n=2 Tax=Neokomagataea TaxID=1223423 RepID=A0A4Y6V3Q0_9PROT|nr:MULTISPECIES: hypothetical protein [Neokomagataea]QDH23994.1 hypothetical protein D5366_00485 [Neokomagataea tanensis]GBR50963.1 hypothetical protein AA106555_0391 [Neokomagataea thailandica NBRC 106555]